MSFLALIAAPALAAATPVAIPAQPELRRQIAAADADFFKLFFEGACEEPRFRGMIADDVEFYHDKGGYNVKRAEDFAALVIPGGYSPDHLRMDKAALRARNLLPPGAQFTAIGTGRWSFPMVAQSVLAGGHVRVGLEDAVFLDRGVLAPSNAAMVEKARRIVEALGARVASPARAREILGLPNARATAASAAA